MGETGFFLSVFVGRLFFLLVDHRHPIALFLRCPDDSGLVVRIILHGIEEIPHGVGMAVIFLPSTPVDSSR